MCKDKGRIFGIELRERLRLIALDCAGYKISSVIYSKWNIVQSSDANSLQISLYGVVYPIYGICWLHFIVYPIKSKSVTI